MNFNSHSYLKLLENQLVIQNKSTIQWKYLLGIMQCTSTLILGLIQRNQGMWLIKNNS